MFRIKSKTTSLINTEKCLRTLFLTDVSRCGNVALRHFLYLTSAASEKFCVVSLCAGDDVNDIMLLETFPTRNAGAC